MKTTFIKKHVDHIIDFSILFFLKSQKVNQNILVWSLDSFFFKQFQITLYIIC